MSDLKKIYRARGPGDAHVLKSLLEAEGIRAVIRGDAFVPLQGGGLFGVDTRPSVWVLADEHYARARNVADGYAAGEGPSPTSVAAEWSCPHCGEEMEAQFTECWKCGGRRAP